MNESYNFVLNLVPKPLPRARHSSRNNFVRSYYPKTVMATFEEYDNEIDRVLSKKGLNLVEQNPENEELTQISMDVVFYMPIPKSTSKKKTEELRGTPHIKTPDLDNLIKMLLDRMSGKFFIDDKFIYKINSEKKYSSNPRIEFNLIKKKPL